MNTHKRLFRYLVPALAVAGISAYGLMATAGRPAPSKGVAARNAAKPPSGAKATFQNLFIQNEGQWDSRAEFLLRSPGVDTWITETGVTYDFFSLRNAKSASASMIQDGKLPTTYRKGHVVALKFAGSTPATVTGMEEIEGKANFLRGSTVATTAKVFQESRLIGLYDGVDMRMYVDKDKPRFDLIVHPGADPNAVRMNFNGATGSSVESPTSLKIQTSVGAMSIGGLFAYQEFPSGRKQVSCSFKQNSDGTIGYTVGKFDSARPLVIDPIVYSTLIGGSGASDFVLDSKTDGLVSGFVCGQTSSASFPTSIGAYDETIADLEGFVAKFLPDGSDVVYSTFVGGGGGDTANALDIDGSGNAYVVGQTASTDLATTGGAFQAASGGGLDGYILKLNSTGTAATYLSYLGGGADDNVNDVRVNAAGNAYVCGQTGSTNLPVVLPVQGTLSGLVDGFVGKFNVAGSALDFMTYLGGSELADFPENAVGLDIDIDDNVYVAMNTNAADAPTTAGVFDRTINNVDAYVVKINEDASLGFATFLGGNANDFVADIALDLTNNIYLTGGTGSFNFPRTSIAYDKSYNLLQDCFLTKMNRTGTGLIYSTFLGTTSSPGNLGPNYGAYPQKVVVDDLGVAHIAGAVFFNATTGVNIPITTNADDPTYNGPTDSAGGGDAYLQVMNESGTGVLYCTYWGSPADDAALSVSLDGARNAYLVGYTNGAIQVGAFPTTPGAFKEAFSEPGPPPPPYEGFLTKIKTRIPITIQSLVVNPDAVASGQGAVGTVTLSGPASSGGATVTISNDNGSVVSHITSFLIPEGTTTGTFDISTTENLTSTQSVLITATVEGDSKSDTLVISPWLTSVTLSNDTVVGGNTVGGRITIFRPAPTGGVSITMNSTVPSVATVPAVVTVPTGLTTQTFDVTTVGVSASQTVDITGSYAGLTRTVTLQVIPADLVSLNFTPTVVSGGTDVQGKVQFNGNAPIGGSIVTLVSSNPSALAVPATVTVPAQEREVTFTGTTSVVTINTSVNVTATYNGQSRVAVVDVLRATLISLAVDPDVIQGGNTSIGTVGLDNPAATGGATVDLSSSNPSVASVPASVTIPSGSTNTNFNIPTTIVVANTTVTITATRGSVILNANLTVLPVSFSVVVDPNSVVGGNSSTGTVTLAAAAPQGGVTVALSSNASAAAVPGSVSIAAGQTSAGFAVATVPVSSTVVATITATYLSSNTTDQLTIEAAGPMNLTLNPSTVSGGGSSTATVQIDGVAPTGGVVVTLSSDTAEATVPASVTVASGNTTATFTVSTTQVSAQTIATITATANGKSADAELTIEPANLVSINFNPKRVRGGQSTVLTVTLDAAAPNGGAVVTISTSNPLIANIPSSVTVPAGQTSRSVTVTTRRVSRNLATQVTGAYNGTAVFTILTVTR